MKELSKHKIEIVLSSKDDKEKREILDSIKRIISKEENCKIIDNGFINPLRLKYAGDGISLKRLVMRFENLRFTNSYCKPVKAESINDLIVSKIIIDNKTGMEVGVLLHVSKNSFLIFNKNTSNEELYLPENITINVVVKDKNNIYDNQDVLYVMEQIENKLKTLVDTLAINGIKVSIKLYKSKNLRSDLNE